MNLVKFCPPPSSVRLEGLRLAYKYPRHISDCSHLLQIQYSTRQLYNSLFNSSTQKSSIIIVLISTTFSAIMKETFPVIDGAKKAAGEMLEPDVFVVTTGGIRIPAHSSILVSYRL